MKNYSVSITAFATVLVVGASSADEALEIACDEVRYGDFDMDEGSIQKEVKAEELPRAKTHASRVIEANE